MDETFGVVPDEFHRPVQEETQAAVAELGVREHASGVDGQKPIDCLVFNNHIFVDQHVESVAIFGHVLRGLGVFAVQRTSSTQPARQYSISTLFAPMCQLGEITGFTARVAMNVGVWSDSGSLGPG